LAAQAADDVDLFKGSGCIPEKSVMSPCPIAKEMMFIILV
jgi:hypothetical protein